MSKQKEIKLLTTNIEYNIPTTSLFDNSMIKQSYINQHKYMMFHLSKRRESPLQHTPIGTKWWRWSNERRTNTNIWCFSPFITKKPPTSFFFFFFMGTIILLKKLSLLKRNLWFLSKISHFFLLLCGFFFIVIWKGKKNSRFNSRILW